MALPVAALPTVAVVPRPAPGNRIVTPPTENPSPPANASPGPARTLDWRWVAGMLVLWLGLTALYELGARELATAFAMLIAASAVFTLGPAAMSEVTKLVTGGS
jgi:hypothetical protein